MATPWPTSSSTLTGFFAPDSTLQTMPYPTSEDWQASFISLVSAMATTTSASPAPSNTTMAAAQTGLSTGTVTGIAVGAAISFILVAVMVAVLCLRRRKNGLGRLPSYQEVSGDAQAQGIPRRAVELPAEVPEEWAQRKVTPERVIGADKNSILREITRPGESSRLNVAPASLINLTGKPSDVERPRFISPSAVEYSPNPVIFSHLRGNQHEYKVMLPEDEVFMAKPAPAPYTPMYTSERRKSRSSPTQYPCYGVPDPGWRSESLYAGSAFRAEAAEHSESRPLLDRPAPMDVETQSASTRSLGDPDGSTHAPESTRGSPSNSMSATGSTPPSTISSASVRPMYSSKALQKSKAVDVYNSHCSAVSSPFGDPSTDLHVLTGQMPPQSSSIREHLKPDHHYSNGKNEMVEVPRPERSPFVVPRKPFPNSSSRYVAPPQSPRSSMETSSPETRANVPYATPTDIHPSASPRTQGQEANATSHTCPECPLSFPTAGQRNKHVNRKHRRRYICPISSCQKAFSLNADMERHKKTVHKELFSFSDSMLKCPLSKCKTPEKLYSRKDNLDRHVKRCFASAKMEKGKGKAG